MPQECVEFLYRQGLADEPALDIAGAHGGDDLQLLAGFNPLHHDLHAQGKHTR